MRRYWIASITLMLLAFAGSASAQAAADQAGMLARRAAVARELVDDPFSIDRFANYVSALGNRAGALVKLLEQYEEERSDKQVGATSSAPGTTTLVSKGTAPKILGLAVENGAVTQSVSGTTATFRANLGGSIRALAGKGYLDLIAISDPASAVLSRISISASFDTSRGSAGAGTLTADRQQLSQWTARFSLLNQRDPQSRAAIRRLTDRVGPSLARTAAAGGNFISAAKDDPVLSAWVADTAAAIEKVRARVPGENNDQHVARLTRVLLDAEASFPALGDLRPATRASFGAFDQAVVDFANERDTLLEEIKSGLLATVEYTNDRPLDAPKLSNVRFVAEAGGTVDLTGNASVTFFDTIPVGLTKRVKAYQASGQLDMKLGSALTAGAFIVSLSGSFIRQLEDSIGEGGLVVPDTKGTIATGQVKLTIPTKASGVKVPFSITFANRTDVIKEKVVRGNIGISYDLDAVFARFKPGV
jgi:hypothetical protein